LKSGKNMEFKKIYTVKIVGRQISNIKYEKFDKKAYDNKINL
jgi:hypothetical protein